MEHFTALSEAGAVDIKGFGALTDSMMIIISPDGIRCAPDLVQPLHNWLFKGGDPPKDWNTIQVFQFEQSAADQHRSNIPSLRFS